MGDGGERFLGRVQEYAQYRARYPEAMMRWMRAETELEPTWEIADVGAGTGMLAEMFLREGCAVLAVEPNAEMRAASESLCAAWPRLRVVDGTAEHTGLPDAGVSMVSVGRAFHWFEPAAAEREFRRIVRPEGWVAIVASGRERGAETEQGAAFQQLLERYGTDAEHVRSWAGRRERTREFLWAMGGGVEPRTAEFRTERWLEAEEFVGETQSLSVAPLAGTAGYEAMQRELRAFFARWSEAGVLRWDAVTTAGLARVSVVSTR